MVKQKFIAPLIYNIENEKELNKINKILYKYSRVWDKKGHVQLSSWMKDSWPYRWGFYPCYISKEKPGNRWDWIICAYQSSYFREREMWKLHLYDLIITGKEFIKIYG